jgi:hypothetical protein
VNADFLGGVYPQANLVTANIDDRDLDIVTDHNRLIALPGQN